MMVQLVLFALFVVVLGSAHGTQNVELTSCGNGELDQPAISLNNAAQKDLLMPVIGLGTFGYAPYGGDPENWNYQTGYDASLNWFSIGGCRWDSAYSYKSKDGVADALLYLTNNYTTTDRSKIFITQKVGDGGNKLGYDNIMEQFNDLISTFKTNYFDLLLIHWPSDPNADNSLDPTCNKNNKEYNTSLCRQHSWQALIDLYNNGSVKAIGVSNFEIKHLNDIISMNSLLPSINQFEFHGYWHEFGLVNFCQKNNITVNSYAPLGAPDVEADNFHNWTYVLTQNPIPTQIGNKYNKSAAQVWLNWAYNGHGVIANPRSKNISHMKQNLDIFDFQLTESEIQQLSQVNSSAPEYPLNKVCPDPSQYP